MHLRFMIDGWHVNLRLRAASNMLSYLAEPYAVERYFARSTLQMYESHFDTAQ